MKNQRDFLSIKRVALVPFLLLALAVPATAPAQDEPATNNEQRTTNNVLPFDMPRQNLAAALNEFSVVTEREIVFDPSLVAGLEAPPLQGDFTPQQAIERLLTGTGLQYRPMASGAYAVVDPNAAALAGENTIGQRRPGIEEIIVTGQKREERIQDVPIAISAFTQEDLTTSQIAGGPDLHLQVPNMTFTKTNFTGYSIQIRGIGTQAVSATTDPAVAVALNQTPFIRNNFFEQEFYDLERLEVLRGPQGTLFGRNATAGVVNLITAKPKFQDESMLSLDKGNYNSQRWEFMLNKPLVENAVALRIAGAGTKRDGYATNELTGNPIDGRDLWSTRVSLRIAPPDGNFDLNVMWEHFEEDDDRIRSGKQLCKKDVATEVGGRQLTSQRLQDAGQSVLAQEIFSQGCIRNSLYAEDSFQTPNGPMLPFYLPLSSIGLPAALSDPYASAVQSRDLRAIESIVDPEYRAKTDIGQIQFDYELSDTLLLESETAYSRNFVFSLQDFNRFNTARGAWNNSSQREGLLEEGEFGGVFCDPQLGCSDRLVLVDLSTAESEQWSQELRLSSSFSGPFNFSLGANYLRYDNEDKYYVFSNSFTLGAASLGNNIQNTPWIPGETTHEPCLINGLAPHDPSTVAQVSESSCQYIDPNPIEDVNDQGHNYFLSKNPYELRSYGIFGEAYYKLTDNLKLTAGLRWSVDDKTAPRIPSQLFAGDSAGYPTLEVIEQTWREPTWRTVLDWKPNLNFTDETLLYGSYAHGYKAGGANPPPFRRTVRGVVTDIAEELNAQQSATRPPTFDAEFVDAFEIGTKNTLLDGALTFNTAAFYYDYEGYQVSEIVERSAFNRNFDLEVWGVEIETDWWALENLRLGLKLGYQKTRIDDGEQAVDLMDRTAGGRHLTITDVPNPAFDSDLTPRPESEYVATDGTLAGIPEDQPFYAFELWEVVRPFPTQASSCITPAYIFFDGDDGLNGVGARGGGGPGPCELAYVTSVDPVTELPYVPNPTVGSGSSDTLFLHDGYVGWNPSTAPNGGEGFFKNLGGNELPNAPNWTATVTADYIVPLRGDWIMDLHTDLYWQDESWFRIFNDHEYNRLDDYFTMNLAAIFKNEVSGWDVMAYVKNVTDEDALTGAFLFSDDVGLTTNLFLVEPRLAGIRVTKHWDGGGPSEWLGQAGSALLGKEPGEPSPWAFTVGTQLYRPQEPENEIFTPAFISTTDPNGNGDPSSDQGKELDWGDGREVVLAYTSEAGWRFSLGARFGESKRDERTLVEGDTFEGCTKYEEVCSDEGRYYPVIGTISNYDPLGFTNYGVSDLRVTEEHLLVDFEVGRDVGLGASLEGTLSAGLRYARFRSKADVTLYGTPDWQIPAECMAGCFSFATFSFGPPNRAQHNEFYSSMKAEREFEGAGPVVTWDASNRLLGNDNGGRLDLDWSLSGGVLFGKQKALVEGEDGEVAYYDQVAAIQVVGGSDLGNPPDSEQEGTPFRYERNDDQIAAVPTLNLGLGLTYRLDGFSIGAGYNWERYYGVIDGGIEERKEYDRTIEGPYLKVTFGGGS